MMERSLTCINCPLGCTVTVVMEGEEIREVRGNTCARGEKYARQEVIAPVRMVTSTVPVKGGAAKTVPVKTLQPIPKELVMECARALKQVTVQAPVCLGDTVIEFAGVPIVAVVSHEWSYETVRKR